MGVFYWQMLVQRGYEEEATACRTAFPERDTAAAIAAISNSSTCRAALPRLDTGKLVKRKLLG